MTKRALPEYRYKEGAIIRAGQLVRGVLSADAPTTSTFIPVPPSKARHDPLYDDRLARVLRAGTPELDVREAIVMRESTRAHHEYQEGERRPTPDDLYELLELEPAALGQPLRPTVFLFDDVLTNGTHFKACKRLLLEHAPATRVIGLFIGRRKLPPEEAQDFASVFADLQ